MNTEATEYSKSGTDDASAKQEEAAFDPNITDPGKQKDKAGEGNSVSSLWLGYFRGMKNEVFRVDQAAAVPVI